MRFRSTAACLILGLAALLVAPALLADGTLLGTINGRVLDQDGKALPGATVEVTSANKGFQRSAVSDAVGSFNFPLLQPGPYIVRVTLAGFQSFEATGVVVSPDKTTAVPATLAPRGRDRGGHRDRRGADGGQDERHGDDQRELGANAEARRRAQLPVPLAFAPGVVNANGSATPTRTGP